MNKTQVLGLVRHLLTFGSGFLIAKGKLDMTGAETIIGAVLALIGGVWSVFSPEKATETSVS
jgi:hypothetical protein